MPLHPLIALALAEDPNCTLTTQCGLSHLLHLLYGTAGVLLVLLLVALAVALYFVRRNKRVKLTP